MSDLLTKSDSMLKHPASLRVFFTTEMWERYGFYVVQSLLALYLAFYFHWDDKSVYALVGSFTAMVYLSPILGGFIADHYLGQKRTILLGAVFLFFSYLALTLLVSQTGLVFSLAAIAVGTGLLKPNISSLLGNEYHAGSRKKESGFTIFYMGITTGIILGTTFPSYLKEVFGWPAAFGSAAAGMLIAFSVFALGVKQYAIKDYQPFQYHPLKLIKALLLIVLLWALNFYVLFFPQFADLFFTLIVLFSVYYLIFTIKQEHAQQGRQTMIIGFLCLISVIFWAFYFQMFLSLTLFISRVVQPTFLGFLVPAPYYVSLQSFGMLAFGFFLARRKIDEKQENLGLKTSRQFFQAMLLMTLAYLIIVLVAYFSQKSSILLSPLLLMLPYLIISLAELLLSPVGLAAISSLAARHKVSTMMGIFFVSLGIGAFLAGKLANLTAIKQNEILSLLELKRHYFSGFSYLLAILFLGLLCCLFLNQFIKRLLMKAL